MDLQPIINSVKDQNLHVLNLVIRQNGRIISKHDFQPEERVLLWSVSKTFTSMAVGIAQSEGFFQITDPLSQYFNIPSDPLWRQVTIRDLLCMGTGQRSDPFSAALNAGLPLDNVEKLFFAEPVVDAPGTHFLYNNAATYMLSKLINMRTGVCLNEYLRPRIFEPLGIKNVRWEADVNGVNFGCSGLYLNADELSRFGQLLLDEGWLVSKHLIPADYIRAAASKQIDTSDFNEYFATADHRTGYGYQMWMNSISGTCRLDGYMGQYVVIIPRMKAVVAITSNEPTKMVNILELVWQYLLDQL